MKNILTTTIATAIGNAAGDETGGASASTIDRNNRQLHEEELYTIFDLATIMTDDGMEVLDMELLMRYQAAAAALVHSSAEFKEGTPEYELFHGLEELGNSDACKAEMEKLLSLQGKNPLASAAHGGIMSRPLFTYTEEDKKVDAFDYSYRYDPENGWRRVVATGDMAFTVGKTIILLNPGTPIGAVKGFISFLGMLNSVTSNIGTVVTGHNMPTATSVILEKGLGIKENATGKYTDRLGISKQK